MSEDRKKRLRDAVKDILEVTHDRGLRVKTVNILVDVELAKSGTTKEQFEKDLDADGTD